MDYLNDFVHLPRFPDGRIDYTHSNKAPVLNCVVACADKVLVLKRSDRVSNYRGKWNVIAGFLDEPKPLDEKAIEEITEEIGISKEDILKLHVLEPYEVHDEKINKTWVVHPVLAILKHLPEIKLDWEHSEYKWILPKDIVNFDRVYKVENSILKASAFLTQN